MKCAYVKRSVSLVSERKGNVYRAYQVPKTFGCSTSTSKGRSRDAENEGRRRDSGHILYEKRHAQSRTKLRAEGR